jgi:hypothetical protein
VTLVASRVGESMGRPSTVPTKFSRRSLRQRKSTHRTYASSPCAEHDVLLRRLLLSSDAFSRVRHRLLCQKMLYFKRRCIRNTRHPAIKAIPCPRSSPFERFLSYFGVPLSPFLPPLNKSLADKRVLTVCLDVDHTLIDAVIGDAPKDPTLCKRPALHQHLVSYRVVEQTDSLLRFNFLDKKGWKSVRAYLRPGARQLLEYVVSLGCELVIFTAAFSSYIDPILKWIDPSSRLISGRLSGVHCSSLTDTGKLFKDLRLLGRDLQQVVLIDDDPNNTSPFPNNSFQVSRWTRQQSEDEELSKLQQRLEKLSKTLKPSTGTEKVAKADECMKSNSRNWRSTCILS